MGPDDLLCSRNAVGLVCLVGRSFWSVWFFWMNFQSDQLDKPDRRDRPDEPVFAGRAQLRIDQAALLAGCGNTLWVRVNFTGLRVLDNSGTPCRMLKMAVQQGRSE